MRVREEGQRERGRDGCDGIFVSILLQVFFYYCIGNSCFHIQHVGSFSSDSVLPGSEPHLDSFPHLHHPLFPKDCSSYISSHKCSGWILWWIFYSLTIHASYVSCNSVYYINKLVKETKPLKCTNSK